MTRMRALLRRIGRRGASLLFVGTLSWILAAALFFAPPHMTTSPGYLVLSDLAPLDLWAFCWTVSACLSWIQAFMIQDRLAFAVATAMWWAYGIAYMFGSITGHNPRGWVGGLLWLAFGGWLNLIATWPEARDLPGRDADA